jgi:hypothetical protein
LNKYYHVDFDEEHGGANHVWKAKAQSKTRELHFGKFLYTEYSIRVYLTKLDTNYLPVLLVGDYRSFLMYVNGSTKYLDVPVELEKVLEKQTGVRVVNSEEWRKLSH